MKYMGTQGSRIPTEVCGAVAFSAPVDLENASIVLDRWDNYLYKRRFRKGIIEKLRIKDAHFPDRIDLSKIKHVRYWRDFDEYFSAPVCGYRNADEFYHHSSAKNFVGHTCRPALLVNALNDPILTPSCFPEELAANHPFFHLETPAQGGHCGFMTRHDPAFAWSEHRALQFLNALSR
jgi:predicted alpha/beta-fold hydrolase